MPNFWRALAVNPEHLSATWHKLKQTMAAGALDPLKQLIAIAVSATNGCRYCINSHTGAAIKLGMDTRMFSELLAVVDVFNGTNRLADAYQVEPDAYPGSPAPGRRFVAWRINGHRYYALVRQMGRVRQVGPPSRFRLTSAP